MGGTHDVRTRLVDAAVELVKEGGPAAATPAAVAERADAAKMSLYRHFTGKDELLAAALAERRCDIRAALADGATGDDPHGCVLAIFDRLADAADVDPSAVAGCPYVITELGLGDADHPAKPVIAAYKQATRSELEALVARGGSADPELTADAVLMLLDGAAVHARIRRSGEPLRHARAAAAALLGA